MATSVHGLRRLHEASRGEYVATRGMIIQESVLAAMARKSRVFVPPPGAPIEVVTPGGYETYKRRAHALLAARGPEARPADITEAVYEHVLGEPLVRREKPDIRREPVSLMLVPR